MIFDLVNNSVIAIHYAEGETGMEEANPLGKEKYLLTLLEACYILQ
jgi:hypothetical protein